MNVEPAEFASAASAVLFAFVFLFGRHIHPAQKLIQDRRTIVSFGAGISTAYLFVRMMPELGEVQHVLATKGFGGLGNGTSIYLVAMLGFLLVYGLDNFSRPIKKQIVRQGMHGAGNETDRLSWRIIGMMSYVFLLTYVLVRANNSSTVATFDYSLAIAFHFLAVDHALHDELQEKYDNEVRLILAGMCILGWLIAKFVAVPGMLTAFLQAFVSGAVIVNTAVMELPTDKDGRFFPFAFGCLLFGLILMAV